MGQERDQITGFSTKFNEGDSKEDKEVVPEKLEKLFNLGKH